MGAPPKGAGKTGTSSSVSIQPRGSVALRNPVEGPLEGGRKAIDDWSFLSYLKNRKGKDVLTSVNRGRCGGQAHSPAEWPRAPGRGQMRPAAFSCTLYSLFFVTRQLMKKSSRVPRAL